jgi:hypothetical protein
MKKFLFVLVAAGALFTSCQKDTGTTVDINSGDLSVINTQLKGTWLFPVQTQSIVDEAGKTLSPDQHTAAPALKFDGNRTVDITPNWSTSKKGTYVISTKNGFVYVDVTYPDGSDVMYQVLLLDNNTLKLSATQPTVYYDGNTPKTANAISTTELKKENSADANINQVRVYVKSDSLYDVGVYVTPAGSAPTDSGLLKSSESKITGVFNYSFGAKRGDHITIDILGSLTKTGFYMYYNGIPIIGKFDAADGEIKTNEGWDVP